MLENVYEGLNVKNVYEGLNVKNVYKGLNARSEVYLSNEYFCKMYPTCVSLKLCKFFLLQKVQQVRNLFTESFTSSLTVISQLGINGVPQSPTISL